MSEQELRQHIAWMAQTMHQAYHQHDPGSWHDCPMNLCASTRSVLGVELPEERERADRAEQALQAAQAEAAVLREALLLARSHLPLDTPEHEATYRQILREPLNAALSGDAGAAFLAERETMRTLIAAYRAWDEHVNISVGCPFCDVGKSGACTVAGRLERELEAASAAYDALSAPAAEPEVNDDAR